MLTAAERKIVTAYLQDRWMKADVNPLWTGLGDGQSWDDAQNWYPTNMPTAQVKVDLLGAEVKVAGTVEALAVENGTLVAEGTEGWVRAKLAADVTVKVGAEARLAVGEYGQAAYAAELDGGTLAATTNFAYSSISGCVLDLDASDRSTLTLNGDGQVVAWRSKTGNGASFVQYTQSQGTHSINPPLYVADSSIPGMPGVRFGVLPDATRAGSVLKADVEIRQQTVFFVLKAVNTYNPFGGQQGFWDSASAGQIRIDGSGAGWGDQIWSTVYGFLSGVDTYISGGFASDGTAKIADKNQTLSVRPINLVAIRRPSLQEVSGDGKPMLGCAAFAGDNYMEGEVYEVVIYDRALTDDEFNAVQTSLMEKWKLDVHTAPAYSNALSKDIRVTATSDSALACVGDSQSLASVSLDAGEATAYPILTVGGLAGTLDLTSAALTLSAESKIGDRQALIEAGSAVVRGPLAALTPGDAPVRVVRHGVRFGTAGALLIVR